MALPVPFYRYKAPWIQWGGARFTPTPGASGSWAGGTMNSPATVYAGDPSGAIGLGGFSVSGGGVLGFSANALFMWLPEETTEARDSEYVLTFSGLTPGAEFGWTGTVGWTVDTVPEVGYLKAFTIGATTKVYRIPPGTSPLFSGKLYPKYDPYLTVDVPPSGIVQVGIYAWAHPSFFKALQFGSFFPGTPGIGPREFRLLATRPGDDVREYAVAKEDDSVRIEFPYVVDALVRETNHLALTARWIPGVGYDAVEAAYWGWDQSGGWARFLRDARRGAEFDFGPDQDDPATYHECKLIEGGEEERDAQIPFFRQTRMVIERTDGQPFSGY